MSLMEIQLVANSNDEAAEDSRTHIHRRHMAESPDHGSKQDSDSSSSSGSADHADETEDETEDQKKKKLKHEENAAAAGHQDPKKNDTHAGKAHADAQKHSADILKVIDAAAGDYDYDDPQSKNENGHGTKNGPQLVHNILGGFISLLFQLIIVEIVYSRHVKHRPNTKIGLYTIMCCMCCFPIGCVACVWPIDSKEESEVGDPIVVDNNDASPEAK
jgi:hypothetical protein